MFLQQTASAPGFGNASAIFLFDITDLTNQKVRFCNNVTNNSATLMGGTNYNTGTMMKFVKTCRYLKGNKIWIIKDLKT